MILPRSIRFPISLTLGAGFKLVFAPASAPRRTARYGATLSVPYDCYLYSTTETGADELEAMSCGFGAADALVSLMVELAEVEPALPAEVALALGDLSHEALDTIKERISSRPTGEVVFAEPLGDPAPVEVPVQAERERVRLRPMSEAPDREEVAIFWRSARGVRVAGGLNDDSGLNIGWLPSPEFCALFSAPDGKELEP